MRVGLSISDFRCGGELGKGRQLARGPPSWCAGELARGPRSVVPVEGGAGSGGQERGPWAPGGHPRGLGVALGPRSEALRPMRWGQAWAPPVVEGCSFPQMAPPNVAKRNEDMILKSHRKLEVELGKNGLKDMS